MLAEYGLYPMWPLYVAAAAIVIGGLLLAWMMNREDR